MDLMCRPGYSLSNDRPQNTLRSVVDLKTVRRPSLATLLTGAGYDLENSAAIGHSSDCGTALSSVDMCTTKTLTKWIFFLIQGHQMYGL